MGGVGEIKGVGVNTAIVGFAGFGLVDLALREAGFRVIGIELDDQIASVNRQNGGECITADMLDVDPRQFVGLSPRLCHFSPPCPNFSQAKAGAAETELDIALARSICRFIRTLKPQFVTLENVWLYRKSESWRLIRHCLIKTGYKLDFWRLCSADYGTPQTRHRMIVLARRDGIKPHKPFPTHAKSPDMFCQPWRGWYEAIEDLIPTLPDSQFAPWQLARLPEKLIKSLSVNPNRNGFGDGWLSANDTRGGDRPVWSVAAQNNLTKNRALLVDSAGYPDNDGIRIAAQRQPDEPSNTVVSNHSRRPMRAFIADGKLNSNATSLTARNCESPVFTVTTSHNNRDVKAFVFDLRHTSRDATVRFDREPFVSVPSHTVRQCRQRVITGGRVVSLTPRCLARFQDMPDWYELPSSNELACKGIGNGVPLNLYRAALQSLGLEATP